MFPTYRAPRHVSEVEIHLHGHKKPYTGCLSVCDSSGPKKKQIHRGQKRGNITIKRAILKFYQRYENKTKKVKNNLEIFLTLLYEYLSQRKVYYQ